MLTHNAKTRVPSQMRAAKATFFTTSHSSQKLLAWAATANRGLATTRIVHVLRMGSLATFATALYGNRQRYIVRQKPSSDSLFGSPAWSENVWRRRCRFTQVTGFT